MKTVTIQVSVTVDEHISFEEVEEYIGFEIGAHASCSADNPLFDEVPISIRVL